MDAVMAQYRAQLPICTLAFGKRTLLFMKEEIDIKFFMFRRDLFNVSLLCFIFHGKIALQAN